MTSRASAAAASSRSRGRGGSRRRPDGDRGGEPGRVGGGARECLVGRARTTRRSGVAEAVTREGEETGSAFLASSGLVIQGQVAVPPRRPGRRGGVHRARRSSSAPAHGFDTVIAWGSRLPRPRAGRARRTRSARRCSRASGWTGRFPTPRTSGRPASPADARWSRPGSCPRGSLSSGRPAGRLRRPEPSTPTTRPGARTSRRRSCSPAR